MRAYHCRQPRVEWSVLDELTQKGNSTGGCDVVAGAQRAEGRPWGGARESQSTEKVKGVTGNGKCWSGKNVKKASDQVLARIYCNDWLPQRQGGLRGWQTWAQPLGWPLSHWVC